MFSAEHGPGGASALHRRAERLKSYQRNMQVLHISSGNLYGGVETLLVTLARFRHLCPQMSPHFALCFEARLSEELRSTGVAVYQLGKVRASQPWTVWRARRALRSLLQREKFDAVICHMPWTLAVFGPAAESSGTAVVFWSHDVPTGKHWVERWARHAQPERVICNSNFTADVVHKLFPNTSREVIYPPVTSPDRKQSGDTRAAVRQELGVPEDAVVVIQVSRLEPWKGQLLHLQALSLLRGKPEWRCWMVGGAQRQQEEAYLNRLRELSAKLGISDRVQFLGQRQDVARLLGAADIHCQPNTGPEPFGITFIEALESGLPVVTTAMGGGKEIVDETCGFLTPPDDATELASVLGRLIESHGLRSRLGKGGPARARSLCDPTQQLARLNDLLNDVTREKLQYVH